MQILGFGGENRFRLMTREGRAMAAQERRGKQKDDLHPYVSTLTLADLESCVALENAAFPETERASREKLIYRLSTCPELCLGLYSTIKEPTTDTEIVVYKNGRPPDSTKPDHRAVLIAHVIATLTTAPAVTDASMEIPPDFKPELDESGKPPVPAKDAPPVPSKEMPSSSDTSASKVSAVSDRPGNQVEGRTLAIHSVAVLPSYQNRGLGRTLFLSFLQRMEGSGITDKAALLARSNLIQWYTKLGFANMGSSEVKFASGGWNEMVKELAAGDPDA
ncbi:hypothetical protein MMC25_007555 [Agyrium rufum]|nr:hypothetical protein [Agyrium rufum]